MGQGDGQADTEAAVAAPGERVCASCGKAKPFDRFGIRRSNGVGGLREDVCLICTAAAKRRRRRRRT
jgi:hypothetical protein